jgi:LPS sulfotransferase NodH
VTEVFFVLGAPRSGTTWLQKLLDAHPEIRCYFETGFAMLREELAAALNRYNERTAARKGGAGRLGRLNQAAFESIASLAFRERLLQTAQPYKFIGDKDPRHVEILRSLQRAFPNAKFIHIIRDGRDGAVSYFHFYKHSPAQPSIFADGFERGALTYAQAWAGTIRRARRNIPAPQYVETRYEALLANPVETLRAMFEFLGADPSAAGACLAEANFVDLSGRKPGEEDATSFYRKGVAGDWRNYFTPDLDRAFKERAGGLIEELGYF